MLGTAGLDLPGLSVPTGLADGLPAGGARVGTRFLEGQLLPAGEVSAQAAGISVLRSLPART